MTKATPSTILALILAIAITASIGQTPAAAAPLTGSGPHLPLTGSAPPAAQTRTITFSDAAGFDAEWTPGVQPAWLGSFSASGPVPSGNVTPAGSTRYAFSTLPNGYLPAGTQFRFGDVDGGSTTTEMFILQAFDTSGVLITTPWLNDTIGELPLGTALTQMPGWNFDGGTGTYTIDGTTVIGNPTVLAVLESNVNILSMDLERTSNFANFWLAAPLTDVIPTPAASLLGFAGIGGLIVRRRQRHA